MTLDDIKGLLDKCKIAYKVKNNGGIEANKVHNNRNKPVSMCFTYVDYGDERSTCISYTIGKNYGDYEGQGCWFDTTDTLDKLKLLLKKFGFDIPEVSYSQMRLF